MVRQVDGGKLRSVVAAIEDDYIAVDGHNAIGSSIGGNTFPTGADGDGSIGDTAFDTYGGIGSGCLEVELYSLATFNGKGDITAHIKLGAHVAARSSGYIGIVVVVLYLPVFGDSVLFVCGKDGSVIRG
jgi:hypothetical protein